MLSALDRELGLRSRKRLARGFLEQAHPTGEMLEFKRHMVMHPIGMPVVAGRAKKQPRPKVGDAAEMELPIVNPPDHGTNKLILLGLGIEEAHASVDVALQRSCIVANAASNVLWR